MHLIEAVRGASMKCSRPIEAASVGGLLFCGDGHGIGNSNCCAKPKRRARLSTVNVQKVAIVCLIGIAVVCALVLFDDYSKCQHEYHRGCAPAVGAGP